MQTCSYFSAVVASALAAIVNFAACASSTPAPGSPSDDRYEEVGSQDTDMQDPAELDETGGATAGGGSTGGADEPPEATGTEGPTDSGRLTQIQQIVKENREPVRDCYKQARKDNKDLQGDLTIHFVLKPDGSVKEASVNQERTTLNSPAVAKCAIDLIKGLKFPAHDKGMETTVNYPFNFKP
jgi:outer membrane biosynthesis protein TonB